MCMMEQHRVMDDPKRPPLPDRGECGTISDMEYADLLKEAVALLEKMSTAQFKEVMEGLK